MVGGTIEPALTPCSALRLCVLCRLFLDRLCYLRPLHHGSVHQRHGRRRYALNPYVPAFNRLIASFLLNHHSRRPDPSAASVALILPFGNPPNMCAGAATAVMFNPYAPSFLELVRRSDQVPVY
jgi:hypothetical protein